MDMDEMCSDELLSDAVAVAERDDKAGRARVAALLADHPADPRLHFLHGSLLAAEGRYAEARTAIGRSVELAPGYDIARFQLGLLELSSGDGAAADATLGPLADAPVEAALVLFARGLRHLARDELPAAAELLRRGIACNEEHPLVSRDMELIIAKIEESAAPPAAAPPAPDEPLSAAHLLLREYGANPTKH
jgi:tetratricopeptide (TPR) repeat protein